MRNSALLFRPMECEKRTLRDPPNHFFASRSYNAQLFPQAVEVLERIRHPTERIEAFIKLGEHIKVSP